MSVTTLDIMCLSIYAILMTNTCQKLNKKVTTPEGTQLMAGIISYGVIRSSDSPTLIFSRDNFDMYTSPVSKNDKRQRQTSNYTN